MSYRPRLWNPRNRPQLWVKPIIPKWLLKHYEKYYN